MMQVVLVSGLSGSGKSIALNVLEDGGFYCVDNLPVELLRELVTTLKKSGHERIAVSMDVRSSGSLATLPAEVAALKSAGFDMRLIFLEAKTDTLVKRFSETRRKHPLSDEAHTLPESIERERELLSAIRDLSHLIDTSGLHPNTLRRWIFEVIGIDRSRLTLLFQSFGFKHGVPLDSDMVFDIRCLPNPYYEESLRPLTGNDEPVIAFLENSPAVTRMFEDIRGFISSWLPDFIRDNRNYLAVSIGCTGGQHRSVYMVERLAKHFSGQVLIRHRELS